MNNPAADILIWPVAIPLLASLLALVFPRRVNFIGITGTAASLVAVVAMAWQVATDGAMSLALGGWTPGLGIALRVDGLSVAMLVMCAVVALTISIYASAYFEAVQKRARFWPLWLMLLTALNALFLSGDVFNIYDLRYCCVHAGGPVGDDWRAHRPAVSGQPCRFVDPVDRGGGHSFDRRSPDPCLPGQKPSKVKYT